jgi:hypothetical protein
MFTKEDIIFNEIYPKIKNNIIKSPELNKLYDFLNNVTVLPYEISSTSSFERSSKSVYELTYASKNIKEKIEKYNRNQTITLRFNNNLVHINIFSDNQEPNTKFLYELKRYIQFTLSIYPVKTNITINYYLSDETKMVKKGILTPNEVNSGSCMISSDHSTIHIWRKEEVLKVTIHEMFHALRHDNYSDNDKVIEYFISKYGTNSSKINTHEAYTEIWANLINCFLISQKYKDNNKKIFRELVTIEKYFSIFQAQKVLFNSLTKEGIDIDRDTNVTSYFLIRAELYQRLNAFLKFCRLENKKYVKIKNINKWLVFLKSKNKIKKNDTIFKGRRKYLFKNLRMTILELLH